MKTFNDVGRVDNLTDLLGILEVVRQPIPIPSPGLDHFWIFGIPVCLKLIQISFSRFLCRGFVDLLKLPDEWLHVLPGQVFS